MKSDIMIRACRPGDEVAAAELVAAVFAGQVAPDYGEAGRREFAQYVYPGAIAERQAGNCVMLLAWAGDTLAGVIECRDFEHISLFFVALEYQGRGIGGELFRRMIGLMRRVRPVLDAVTVYASPFAVPVYRRLGFAATDGECCVNGIRFTPMRLDLE